MKPMLLPATPLALVLALVLALTGCAGGPDLAPDMQAAPLAAAPGSAPVPADAASSASPRPGATALVPAGPLQPLAEAQAAGSGVAMLETPPDLWDRIRRGFAMPALEGDLVRQHEQWYASRPEYIQRMTERSRKYLFHIVEELERRGMPAELALLPYIESAFNPQAVSSARAAGIWQFMPATGADFDLRQNVFRDDRRDVLASTRAALDYLQKLHAMFGDWHLALAAYNWGQGNVSRAIARNQRAGLGTAYTDLNMPNETRHYVPKLQAVKNIVANPAQFRAELPLIENHPYFQTVTITRDIDVALAARLADVRLEDFKALNPSLNRPVILAAGTPQILLPWDNATVFQRNFEGYSAGRYASWTAWTAPATMTVAEAARRVGMSEADFRSVNNIPPRMLIRAGSTVLAPRAATVVADVTSRIADTAQLSLTPEAGTRRTTVKAGKQDTVASIAARYRVKAADVARWNAVEASARFNPGQTVTLELPVRTAKAGGTKKAVAKAPAAKAGNDKTGAKPTSRVATR
jgi:membrane-bound lytic murein transglycosylase D